MRERANHDGTDDRNGSDPKLDAAKRRRELNLLRKLQAERDPPLTYWQKKLEKVRHV